MCGSGTRQVTRFPLVHGDSGVGEPKIGPSRTGPGLFLPIMIECVLNTTRADKIQYLGQSWGAVLPVVGLSLFPFLCEKVADLVLLAPPQRQ